MAATPVVKGKPVSVLTYSAPSGPRRTRVGTASAWPNGGGAGTLGNVVTSETSPFAVTSNSSLAPASVTKVRPGSASTPKGFESTTPPAGLFDTSNAETSATTRQPPLG